MTDWFRSWHGAPTDPKWLGIAKRAGIAPGIAVAIGWALMDRASQAAERGCISGYDADGLACFFGCEAEQVDAVVAAMREKGMLADDRFAAWERRQPKREDDSTQRVREHRERNKPQAERNVTQRNAPDTDTETEKKDSEANASGASAPLATLDPKAILFDRGLSELSRLTDRPPAQLRPVLGRWLKLTANDAGAILAEIEKCRGSPVADPIAWIERQLKPQERTNGNTADSQHERNRRALANVVAKRSHAGGDAMVSAAFADPRQPQAISYLEPGERPQGDARLRTG